MMAQRVGPHRAGFGESAFWSEAEQAVWWIDLHGRALLRTHEDGATFVFKTPGFPANNPRAIVPGRDGHLIVALDDRLARFNPADGTFIAIDLTLPVPPGHVLNDATVDTRGRLIIGTVRAAGGDDYAGVIIAVSPEAPPRILADGLCVPNGLAVSPDGTVLYFCDSHRDVRTVWRTTYNPDTGAIDAPMVCIAPEQLTGRPDGATMDIYGGYWIAELETGRVLRFTPDGQLSASMEWPVSMPSRPCFGGPNGRDLYVTTAGPLGGLDDGESGGLFRAATVFTGAPTNRCAL